MSIAIDNPRKLKRQDKFRTTTLKALIDHDLSVKELAEKLGLARNTVSIAINHATQFPDVKERIRTFLKL